jgi:ribosome-associated heat shock protein Hsp15
MTDQKVRLDKWLWAARFFKTRGLAKAAIEGGKVHFNGQRCKVSKIVEVNAELKIRQGIDEKTICVKAISEHRRGAPEAQLLYDETPESIAKRTSNAEMRKTGSLISDRRPNKKERRDIKSFKNLDFE